MNHHAAHDRASLAVGAAFLLLYGFTAAPGLLFADSAEFQTVAMIGGIPHSTGYPLWLVLARAFTWLPLGAPEFRVTLFSAVCGAIALALLVRRLGDLGASVAAAVAAACVLGLSFSFWRVAVRAEVYTLSIALALAALGALLRARAAPPESWRDARIAALLLGFVLSVHLGFAPTVAIAGLALAWREWRAAPKSLARPLVLLGAFLAGLTPYLLLVALDAAGTRANFIDLVRHAKALMPLTDGPPIETAWDGVRWLVTGRNIYPPQPFEFHPRSILDNLAHCAAILGLFEVGPLAALLGLAGLVRLMRSERALAWLLAAALASSMLFAATMQFGAMLHLFQIPAIVIAALLAGLGADVLLSALPKPPALRAAAAAALVALCALPPAAIRVHASTHPIGARGWRVEEEDRALKAGWIPGMQGERRAERWSNAAMDAIPQDALVLAMWSDFAPLRHLQLARGRRIDLTIDQIAGETLAARIRQWQEHHDLARAPIVFAARGPREAPWLAAADSVAMPDGRFLFVVRRPFGETSFPR